MGTAKRDITLCLNFENNHKRNNNNPILLGPRSLQVFNTGLYGSFHGVNGAIYLSRNRLIIIYYEHRFLSQRQCSIKSRSIWKQTRRDEDLMSLYREGVIWMSSCMRHVFFHHFQYSRIVWNLPQVYWVPLYYTCIDNRIDKSDFRFQ